MIPDWKSIAMVFYGWLDDIDTYSDMCKADTEMFQTLTLKRAAKRHELISTDGYITWARSEPRPDGSKLP